MLAEPRLDLDHRGRGQGPDAGPARGDGHSGLGHAARRLLIIRAVVLDFGGVLWDMRWDVARELERAHDLPRLSVFETLYRSPAWHHIERGAGDALEWQREAHRALEARAGRPLPPLHDEWRRAQGVISANVELVRALRSEFKVSVLSNADASLSRRLETELGIHHLFDDVVCSAEVGMAKPDAAVFRLAASRLGLEPAECAFVDDAEDNVAAARAVGMAAVHYRAHRGDDLRAGLRDAGVRLHGA